MMGFTQREFIAWQCDIKLHQNNHKIQEEMLYITAVIEFKKKKGCKSYNV